MSAAAFHTMFVIGKIVRYKNWVTNYSSFTKIFHPRNTIIVTIYWHEIGVINVMHSNKTGNKSHRPILRYEQLKLA